jgi:hypothetical protein
MMRSVPGAIAALCAAGLLAPAVATACGPTPTPYVTLVELLPATRTGVARDGAVVVRGKLWGPSGGPFQFAQVRLLDEAGAEIPAVQVSWYSGTDSLGLQAIQVAPPMPTAAATSGSRFRVRSQSCAQLGVLGLALADHGGADLGKTFDSSVTRGQPAEFPLGGVIPGWTEGVQLMVPGEKARFCSPGRSPTATSPPSPAPPRARWRSTSSCSRSSKSCADLPTGKFAARKPRAR